MREPKHTPGPWKASSDDAPVKGVYGCGYRIATMTGGELTRDIANSRLIAAAPDLLAACQAALDEDNGMMCSDQLRAAIDKAFGEEN